MKTVDVEQAIFASADHGAIRGYQLVARSRGIDRRGAQVLCRWSPTQLPGELPGGAALSCFPVSDETVAVARTFEGGPEYSGRGTAEVITRILLLRHDLFQAYAYNAVAVAQTALAMGLLKMPLEERRQSELPLAALPSCPLVDSPAGCGSEPPAPLAGLLDELRRRILAAQRVAVIGWGDPLETLRWLVPQLPEPIRRRFSFTTGLWPASQRPFQVHFFAVAGPPLQLRLRAQGVISLTLRPTHERTLCHSREGGAVAVGK